jgi:hypothetical protein
MNCHATAKAIGRALLDAPGLDGVHIYAHDTEILSSGYSERVAEMQLPAIFISVSGAALCGSPTIGRMKAQIVLGSQSDTDSAATHSARETGLRARLADVGSMNVGFAAVGNVLLKGKVVIIANDPGVDARAFTTPVTCILGVESTG